MFRGDVNRWYFEMARELDRALRLSNLNEMAVFVDGRLACVFCSDGLWHAGGDEQRQLWQEAGGSGVRRFRFS